MAKTIINDTNLVITDFKINRQNELEELKINDVDVSLGEESALEDDKTAAITENGTIEIEPSTGYDGMKKVTATVTVGATLYAWIGNTESVTGNPRSIGYTITPTPQATQEKIIYFVPGTQGSDNYITVQDAICKEDGAGADYLQVWKDDAQIGRLTRNSSYDVTFE